MHTKISRQRFRGCIVGSALGDAIGNMAFAYPLGIPKHQYLTDLEQRISLLEDLTYTDDTAMVIGLCESILANGGIDEQHLGDTLATNFYKEPWRGYAAGPPIIFQRVNNQGLSYRKAAQSLFGGQGSYGNGAAMRIAPLALLYGHRQDLYSLVENCAAVTNAHAVGIDGAAIIAKAIAIAAYRREELTINNFIRPLQVFSRTPEMIEKLILLEDIYCHCNDTSVAARRLGTGTLASESVPFALYTFLCNQHSYKDCILQAGFHGGDSDTIAAMVGAISGVYLGENSLPLPWSHLENKNYLLQLSNDLHTLYNYPRSVLGIS
ncbi:ADP-ribosylglycohydrolase family protein [Candidatus Uabimicrobium sp. HlEnr_7]|uniref:ADP-ribosylglycohydrolase family protein n=1 Tax=Candidatus Uabimicrobium helgolandensis TaxID=3095367 RepID=UPI0035587E01